MSLRKKETWLYYVYMKKYTIITLSISLILLIIVGWLILWESRYPVLKISRMILGSIIVLFVPWYWITRWSFPLTGTEAILDPIEEKITDTKEKENEEIESTNESIDGLERFVLSVALSISSVPLLLFYVNFLWVPLTIWSVYGTIVVVSIAAMWATIYIEKKYDTHNR